MAIKLPWIAKAEQRAIERARPEIEKQVVAKLATEITRVANYNNQGQPIGPQGYGQSPALPSSYPQIGGSPYAVYGMDRPIWYATPTSPRRRPDSLVDWDTIRRFARTYDIARSCINHLKREVTAQAFNVTARDKKDKSEATIKRIHDAMFLLSDKRGVLGEPHENRRLYELKIMEDLLVAGCMAVEKVKTKGGKLLQAVPFDAVTIRPKTDAYGWPGPGEAIYQQWIMGMVTGEYKADQIDYTGMWPETNSPYFVSPIEYLITTILAALKVDGWNRTWLTDGTTPSDLLAVPEAWTPDQIITYTEYFNGLLAGNSAERQKTKFVPTGTQKVSSNGRKDQDFAIFELWLARRTSAIYGVQLASIGFSEHQYKSSHEDSNKQTTQFGAGVLLEIRKEHYDGLLYDLGYGDLEVSDGVDADESPAARDERLGTAVQQSLITINEAKAERGDDPVAGGNVFLIPAKSQLMGIDGKILNQEPDPADPSEPNADTNGEPDPKDKPKDDDDPKEAKLAKGSEARASEAQADLARWQRKSLGRLKTGKAALCRFESESIDSLRAEAIYAGLASARSADDVKALFRAEDDEDDEDDEAQAKKKHHLILLLIGAMEAVSQAIKTQAGLVFEDKIDPTQFVANAMDSLIENHIQAAWLGRIRAGGTGAISAADRALGAREAATQVPFLTKMANAIFEDRKSQAQIGVQAEAYGRRLVGTANKAWASNLPDTTLITWNDTGDDKECEDCPVRADNSPYTPETIPGVPGDCSTACLGECRCYLSTDDGQTSFYDPTEHPVETKDSTRPKREQPPEGTEPLLKPYVGGPTALHDEVVKEGIEWVRGNAPKSGWQDIYDQTQAALKSSKKKSVQAFRGTAINEGHEIYSDLLSGDLKVGDTFKSRLPVFGSFSESKKVAESFAEGAEEGSTDPIRIVIRRTISGADIVAGCRYQEGFLVNEKEIIAKSEGEAEYQLVDAYVLGADGKRKEISTTERAKKPKKALKVYDYVGDPFARGIGQPFKS